MPAPRTGTMKRFERGQAIAAAKVLNDAIDRAYYEEYPIAETVPRHRALDKAQTAFNSTALAYFLGVRVSSIHARLMRRAKRRKAAEQGSLVA